MASDSGVCSPSPANTSVTGSSGHKNSLKGTKLARRAKSFKDDLFEKISQMRTPTNTLGRSHSPHSPRSKHAKPHINDSNSSSTTKPSQSLQMYVREIRIALEYFRNVISKKKLEVLPDNGTVILELIASMYAVIQTYTLNENSSTLISATTQVYLSLGKLIKLCDEVLLCDEESEITALNNENVKEVVDLVDNAVQNLVNLANEKLKEKDNALAIGATPEKTSSNTLMRPTVDIAAQRTSLPDIPLTPNERDILEKSTSNPIRASHSTESILRDTSPPPKPPLPNRISNPPPLPPKKRSIPTAQVPSMITNSHLEYNLDSSLLGYGVDHLSMRSKSPDDNSSLLSVSAGSLDSALNHSREEDELKAIALDTSLEDQFLENDVERMFAISFASMQSIRASMQSVSTKRSSEQSMQSQKSSIASSNDLSCLRKLESFNFSESNITEQSSFVSTSSSSSTFTRVTQQQQMSSAQGHSLSNLGENADITNNSISNSSTFTDEDDGSHAESSQGFFRSERLLSLSESGDIIPPALPMKTRRNSAKNINKHLAKFDHFEETDHAKTCDIFGDELPELRHNTAFQWQSKHQSLMDSRRFNTFGSDTNVEQPPPLPMKKKHIIAYMEICSSSTRSTEQLRHSMHTYNVNHSTEHFSAHCNISHSQTMNLSPIRKQMTSSATSSPIHEKPPALPPKNKQRMSNCKTPPTIITTPPPSPKPTSLSSAEEYENRRILTPSQGSEMSTVNEEQPELAEDDKPEGAVESVEQPVQESSSASTFPAAESTNEEDEGIVVVLRNNAYNKQEPSPTNSLKKENMPNILEEIDISDYLVFKKDGEDGPDIKGGYLDALIVHASRVQKNSENAFGEAFITTFRTFIQPLEVIEKLTHRYTIFCCQVIDQKQKAAKETFSLLVRVVNDLTSTDLTPHLLTLLVEFVYQLVCSGQLSMAKLLRKQIVHKVTTYKRQKQSEHSFTEPRNIITNQPTLLDLKSLEIAEQMTLLDAELFRKIEIPEVLLFAKEQCEEKSPNLNKFTEHFNKMSYWARSQILVQTDAKDREKHVIKFIKIMKHLRKMNNYNSYLALLSALDSAPIRRLEWHKTITEGLKEYCALIDSSSSFRIYRQALAETSPPCIPYIGLVLQDLTFVHVGNPDYLKDSIINFSKRWQQYNIIVNMKRFKKCEYPFRRNERIIRFFENFENFLGEEQMWQISENIKPRGRRAMSSN